MGYMKAKLRGVVVLFIILGLAAVFGWSDGTTDSVIGIVFFIGLILFIASLLSRRGRE